MERYIPHDGRMHTPPRLARGLPLLGRVHALLAGAEVSPAGRSVEFANHIDPGAVLSGTRAGTARIRGWHPPPDERRMASQAERLAELATRPAKPAWWPGCRGSWCTVTFGMTTSSSKARPWCLPPTSPSWPNGPASTTWP